MNFIKKAVLILIDEEFCCYILKKLKPHWNILLPTLSLQVKEMRGNQLYRADLDK